MNVQIRTADALDNRSDSDWWRGAVIYQVYPRSFRDSNGDGIGDLAGIAERLPHIASLGVDALWISPFFRSPMRDFGYDVSDYRDVDPMFGTLGDFDGLLARAHDSGLRVMIDLVLSHTSDQHPWFAESRRDASNPKSDWYVWADPKPDGTPAQQLAVGVRRFGLALGRGRRQQYYLHNFLASQPDLNFHNAEVQDQLLGRGGILARARRRRLPAGHHQLLHARRGPARQSAPAGRSAQRHHRPAGEPVQPSGSSPRQEPTPGNLAFLRRLRAVMEPHGAVAVGEVGDAQKGLEIMAQYTAGNDLMHMCYAFELLTNDRPTAEDISSTMTRFEDVASDSWPCWAFSQPRHGAPRDPAGGPCPRRG